MTCRKHRKYTQTSIKLLKKNHQEQTQYRKLYMKFTIKLWRDNHQELTENIVNVEISKIYEKMNIKITEGTSPRTDRV